MRVIFEHQNWTDLEEGAVTKTKFFGVQRVWFNPSEGLICLLLQSGWVYEHFLEENWEYSIIPEDEDEASVAVGFDGNPRGYFRS